MTYTNVLPIGNNCRPFTYTAKDLSRESEPHTKQPRRPTEAPR